MNRPDLSTITFTEEDAARLDEYIASYSETLEEENPSDSEDYVSSYAAVVSYSDIVNGLNRVDGKVFKISAVSKSSLSRRPQKASRSRTAETSKAETATSFHPPRKH